MSLNQKAVAGNVLLMLAMAALLFIPAGTMRYWQAWIFLAVFFAFSLAITLYLMFRDPELLARRMRGGPTAEKSAAQKTIMSIVSVCYVFLLVVPALDHRFGWSHVHPAVVLIADTLIAVGWIIMFLVFRENSFSAATVEIVDDQVVVSTGPYALARHPMYAGGLIMLLAMPVALGSWWGLLMMAAMLPALVWRLFDEEAFLSENLPGYAEYRQRVRYRLIPGMW